MSKGRSPLRQETNKQTPDDPVVPEIDKLRKEVARLKTFKDNCGQTAEGNDLYGRLLDTLDELKDGVVILDKSQKVQYANAIIKEIIFLQDPTGSNIYDTYPNPGTNFLKNLTMSLSDNKAVISLEYVPRQRSWYKVNIRPLQDFTVVIFYDNSSYEHLSEKYKLTHYTMDNVQEYVLWVNSDGTIAFVNDYVRKSMGFSRKDLANLRVFGIIKDLPEPSWEDFLALVKSKTIVSFESMVKNVYDKMFPGDITANFVRFRNMEYIVFFIRDITERKKTQDELNTAKAQAELYLDLMCHDINNMNQVGMGYLSLALESGDTGPISKGLLDTTMESFEKSTALINNVKKLQILKSSPLLLHPVNLADVVGDVVKQNVSPNNRDVRVNYECRTSCEVMANSLVKDIFENIIGNAIKHSSGPLTIDVSVEKTLVDGTDQCRITISDTGPGIPDDMKNKILNRIDVNKQRAAGRGLGLYLVKTLVEDFHGRIWIEDRVPGEYEKGTKVVVILPTVRK